MTNKTDKNETGMNGNIGNGTNYITASANIQHLKGKEKKDLDEMIHYFKIELTPTNYNLNRTILNTEDTEIYSLQFTQIPSERGYFDYSSLTSNFDWISLLAMPILLILIFGSSSLKSSEELNAFYTCRLNPMATTYFWGSLMVSVLFHVLTTE